MGTSTWGAVYWPGFLIVSALVVVLGFGIPELIALLTPVSQHVDNTLSWYARSELGVNVAVQGTRHTLAWWASFVAWMTFVIFITAHIWFAQFH